MPTFYDRFVDCANRWPNNISLEIQRHDHLESCTYAELHRWAESVGRWITENNLPRGSRLGILADNHPRWVAAYLGIIASGCVAVPLDTALHADQVVKLLQDSGTSAVFVDAKHVAVAKPAATELNVPLVLTDPDRTTGQARQEKFAANLPAIFEAGPGNFKPIPSNTDDLASLLYTSGTTADPKGVMLTHGNLLGEVDAVFNWVDLGPSDALLGVLPLFHVLALMANMLLPLIKGSRVLYLETLNTTELMKALHERGITAFAVVPQFYYLIHERIFSEIKKRGPLTQKIFGAMIAINHILRKIGINAGPVLFRRVHNTLGPKMRYFATGGSRFDPAIQKDFYDLGIDIMQALGLTETAAAIYVNSPDDIVFGSCGKAMKGVEGKIVDPQPQEDGVPAVGELAVRGPMVMKGYWNRPDATAEVLREDWLYTGDLGYFDSHGNLFVTGRKKEVIVTPGGTNVYPGDLEAALRKQPEVKDCVVIGIERGGNAEPCAVLILREKVDLDEVMRRVNGSLAEYQRMLSWHEWPQEDFPRTSTQKPRRNAIAEVVRKRMLVPNAADASSAGPLAELISRVVGRNVPAIREDAQLDSDLGLSSLDRVELMSALEDRYQVDLSETRFSTVRTVGELERMLRGEAAPTPAYHYPSWVLGWPVTWLRLVAHYLLMRPAIVLLGWPRILGRDNLRGIAGPLLVVGNHLGDVDPGFILTALPARFRHRLAIAAGGEALEALRTPQAERSWLLKIYDRVKWVLGVSLLNLFPLPREAGFRRSFAYAGEAVDRGYNILVFPEGRHTTDGKLCPFRAGIGLLAQNLGIPVLPMRIDGLFEVKNAGRKFAAPWKISVRIGRPITFGSDTSAEEIAGQLRKAVENL